MRAYLYLQEVLGGPIDLLEALLARLWHGLHDCSGGRRNAWEEPGISVTVSRRCRRTKIGDSSLFSTPSRESLVCPGVVGKKEVVGRKS